MKKYLLLLFIVPLWTNGQKKNMAYPFEKKDQLISIQYGFPNTIKNSLESFPGFTQLNKKSIGPVAISYDYFVQKLFSIGACVSYANYNADYKDIAGFNLAFTGKLSNISLTVQTVKYLETEGKVLPYAKGNVGLNIWNGSYQSANGQEYKKFTAPTPVSYNAVVGIRYGFGEKASGYLEAGYGKYIVAAGISLKIEKKK